MGNSGGGSSGPASAMVKLDERIYNALTNANADFQNIPQTYRHLLIVAHIRTSANGSSSLQFNGDAGANYDTQLLQGAGASAAAAETLGTGGGQFETNGAATEGTTVVIHIGYYADATLRKTARIDEGASNGNLTGNTQARSDVTHWRNTAAINRVTLVPAGGGWQPGTCITLYGLA